MSAQELIDSLTKEQLENKTPEEIQQILQQLSATYDFKIDLLEQLLEQRVKDLEQNFNIKRQSLDKSDLTSQSVNTLTFQTGFNVKSNTTPSVDSDNKLKVQIPQKKEKEIKDQLQEQTLVKQTYPGKITTSEEDPDLQLKREQEDKIRLENTMEIFKTFYLKMDCL